MVLAGIGRDASAGVHTPNISSRKSELSWSVLAAFQVLLARYSRQEDLTIGTTKSVGDPEVNLPVAHGSKSSYPLSPSMLFQRVQTFAEN